MFYTPKNRSFQKIILYWAFEQLPNFAKIFRSNSKVLPANQILNEKDRTEDSSQNSHTAFPHTSLQNDECIYFDNLTHWLRTPRT